MISTKLGWLATEVLLWWCFAYLGSGMAMALALMLLLVPLCAIPISVYLRKHLDIHIEAPVSQRKGDDGSVRLKLYNPTIFPAMRVLCDIKVQNQLNRETQEQKVTTWVMPRSYKHNALRIGSEYCGRMRIWVSKVTLYDCFGIFGVSFNCDAVAHMTVQPDTFEPVIKMAPHISRSDDSESYSQERPGSDMTEIFQIREYVIGDSPRQVHWKLTNKLDKLIVRDPGLPISKDVMVFWERTGEGQNPSLIDAQAEVVISLCRSLIDNGIQFTIGWNDTDRNLCIIHRIRDLDELVAIIPRLLRAAGAANGESGATLLMQTKPESLCAHMVYVAEKPQGEVIDMQRYGHVTMLVCGDCALDKAICFNENDYIYQLKEIEI